MASSKLTKSSSSIKKKASSSTTKPYKGISGTSDLVYRGSGNEKPVNAVYRRGKTKGLDQTMKEGLEAWNKKEREYFNKQKTGEVKATPLKKSASSSSTATSKLVKASTPVKAKKMLKTATPRKTTTAPNKTGNTKKYIY